MLSFPIKKNWSLSEPIIRADIINTPTCIKDALSFSRNVPQINMKKCIQCGICLFYGLIENDIDIKAICSMKKKNALLWLCALLYHTGQETLINAEVKVNSGKRPMRIPLLIESRGKGLLMKLAEDKTSLQECAYDLDQLLKEALEKNKTALCLNARGALIAWAKSTEFSDIKETIEFQFAVRIISIFEIISKIKRKTKVNWMSELGK